MHIGISADGTINYHGADVRENEPSDRKKWAPAGQQFKARCLMKFDKDTGCRGTAEHYPQHRRYGAPQPLRFQNSAMASPEGAAKPERQGSRWRPRNAALSAIGRNV